MKSLPYQPIHQVALQVSRPFWEDDDLEPSMWTDSIGRVSAIYHEAKDDQVSSLLVSAFGPGARHLDRLGKDGVARYVVAQIEQMRPAAKGALQVIGQHSWETGSIRRRRLGLFQSRHGHEVPARDVPAAGPRALLRRAHFGDRARHGRGDRIG